MKGTRDPLISKSTRIETIRSHLWTMSTNYSRTDKGVKLLMRKTVVIATISSSTVVVTHRRSRRIHPWKNLTKWNAKRATILPLESHRRKGIPTFRSRHYTTVISPKTRIKTPLKRPMMLKARWRVLNTKNRNAVKASLNQSKVQVRGNTRNLNLRAQMAWIENLIRPMGRLRWRQIPENKMHL